MTSLLKEVYQRAQGRGTFPWPVVQLAAPRRQCQRVATVAWLTYLSAKAYQELVLVRLLCLGPYCHVKSQMHMCVRYCTGQ